MNICERYRFPPEIIQYGVWHSFRFNPSHRDTEDLLAQRGSVVIVRSDSALVRVKGVGDK